jgi:glycosyltransferase involved in cell wall biosynthesis
MKPDRNFSHMTLGVIWEDYHSRCGNTYYCTNTLWKFFDALAVYWKRVILSTPVISVSTSEAEKLQGLEVTAPKVIYHERPGYRSKAEFLKRLPMLLTPTLAHISTVIRAADVVLIRLPSPLGIFAYLLSKLYGRQVFLYIAGDLLERNTGKRGAQSPAYYGRALLAHAYDGLDKWLVKRAPSLITGAELFERYGQLGKSTMFHVSLMSEKQIWLRQDTCTGDQIRLFFVGRLQPVKGITFLLEAVKLLSDPRVILDIAGDGELKDMLEAEVKESGMKGKIALLGAVRYGEELFDLYRQADIFVFPSLSEGVPKVLMEAMAFGVPIVASKVGGIPSIIKHRENGLLVEPGDAQGIAQAIEELISDDCLRRRMIQNNYRKIRNYTIESQIRRFMDFLSENCKRGSRSFAGD